MLSIQVWYFASQTSDILEIIGSSLMDQILSLKHAWIWYMFIPLMFDFPISSVFIPHINSMGLNLGPKKTRCFGITEAYIDTVLSSKEFITSAQNAHGFLLAENGKVWVMFFGGGQQGGNKYLGGWVELWLGMGKEKWKNNLWCFQSVDIENFGFLMRNPLTVAPEDGWKITEYFGDSWWHRFRCYVPFQEGRSWKYDITPITPVNESLFSCKTTKKYCLIGFWLYMDLPTSVLVGISQIRFCVSHFQMHQRQVQFCGAK